MQYLNTKRGAPLVSVTSNTLLTAAKIIVGLMTALLELHGDEHVLEVGRELGMSARRDPVSQAIILSDAVNQVTICPGTAVALVNDKLVDLGRPAQYYKGRLIVPVEGLRRVTARQ